MTSSPSAPSRSTGSWAFASLLAGKIQPLRPVRLTSNDGTTTRIHWSGWVESVHPAVNKYGERLVKILCTGALQFLSSTQTKIELQENQRSDQIIDALIQEVIFPPALSDSWVLGDPDLSKLGETRRLFRPKGAFHSRSGLIATVALVLNPYRLI